MINVNMNTDALICWWWCPKTVWTGPVGRN